MIPRRLARAAFCAIWLLSTANLHGQGCAQCKDNAAATPPATQAAYRQAIFFLGGAGLTLFTATLVILRRHR